MCNIASNSYMWSSGLVLEWLQQPVSTTLQSITFYDIINTNIELFDVFSGIGDEVLEQYIVEDLSPYWKELGRKLKLSQSFLDNTCEQYPSNPTEQLRAVLHEWRDRTTCPTVAKLDRLFEEFGLQNFIPGRRPVLERSHKGMAMWLV